MAGIRKNKQYRRKKKRQQQNRTNERSRPTNYEEIMRQNINFEQYYKAQKLITDPEEWIKFMSILTQPLPSAFRFTDYGDGQADILRSYIESDEFSALYIDQNQQDVLSCLPWYPGKLAWQFNVSRVDIRKNEALKKLHNFFISETESGYISRQEAVSMIPPLVLDVQPHHKVLDMCAAPGSKTAQLIEMLHSKNNRTTAEGVVVANDVDNARCYMLVHQAKRLHSPCSIITNHDAGGMPNLYEIQNGMRRKLKYDRILCDVPCSGDGTVRKNYDVWKKWKIGNGNNFNNIQFRILKRGLELLAKDGLLVYSTCSLNPVEDEAVVSNMLILAEGAVELVDVCDKLPGLKYKEGIEDWTVMAYDSKKEDVKVIKPNEYEQLEERFKPNIRPTLFPPKNIEKLNIKRCMRIMPHYQNTGGFFVAVFRKIIDKLPWNEQEIKEQPNINDNVKEGTMPTSPPKKKRRQVLNKEDPFLFFKRDEQEWPPIKDNFGINELFPYQQLLYRGTSGKKRNIYFLSDTATKIIEHNDHIKFVNAGVRIFSRTDDKVTTCGYRLCQEGLLSLLPFFHPEKTTEINCHDAKLLLSVTTPPTDEFECLAKLEPLPSGCCVFLYNHQYENKQITLPICAWKGKNTMRAYVAQNEKIHFLRLLGVDVSEMIAQRKFNKEDKCERVSQQKDSTCIEEIKAEAGKIEIPLEINK